MIKRIHKLNQSRAVDGPDLIQLLLFEQWAEAMIAEVLAIWNTEMLNIRNNSFLNKCHGNGSKPIWLLKILINYLKVRRKYPEVTVNESSILWPPNFNRYLEKSRKEIIYLETAYLNAEGQIFCWCKWASVDYFMWYINFCASFFLQHKLYLEDVFLNYAISLCQNTEYILNVN